MIADRPHEPSSLHIAAWANAHRPAHIDDLDTHTVNLIGPTHGELDREHAMRTNLAKPVLVASLEADRQPTPLLIDGVHRLYRAWREGVASLPAYVLTVAETQQIKHDRLIGGGNTPRRRTTPRRDR